MYAKKSNDNKKTQQTDHPLEEQVAQYAQMLQEQGVPSHLLPSLIEAKFGQKARAIARTVVKDFVPPAVASVAVAAHQSKKERRALRRDRKEDRISEEIKPKRFLKDILEQKANAKIHPVEWLTNHPAVDLDRLEMETGSDPSLMRQHYKDKGIDKEFKKQFSKHDFDNAAFHAFVSRDPSEYQNKDTHRAESRRWWKEHQRSTH